MHLSLSLTHTHTHTQTQSLFLCLCADHRACVRRRVLAQRRARDRSPGARHCLQLLAHLPPESTQRQAQSTEGASVSATTLCDSSTRTSTCTSMYSYQIYLQFRPRICTISSIHCVYVPIQYTNWMYSLDDYEEVIIQLWGIHSCIVLVLLLIPSSSIHWRRRKWDVPNGYDYGFISHNIASAFTRFITKDSH